MELQAPTLPPSPSRGSVRNFRFFRQDRIGTTTYPNQKPFRPSSFFPVLLFSYYSLGEPVVGRSKDAPMNPFNLPDGQEPHVTRYVKFIQSRQETPHRKFETTTHHIIPRSLGGSDLKENLIVLTHREHFIAHLLLWKAYGGPMASAFYFMTHGNTRGRHHASTLTAKQYAGLTEDRTKRQSAVQKSENMADAHKKQGQSLKTRLQSDSAFYRSSCKRLVDYNKSEKGRAEQSERMSGAGNPIFGKKREAHVALAVSISMTKRLKDSRWMNDGSINKQALTEDQESLLSRGWVYGRLNQPITTPKGTIHMTNGVETRCVSPDSPEVDELVTLGWWGGQGFRGTRLDSGLLFERMFHA